MIERRAISVEGIVQGVGFRPYVFNLASKLHLRGFVKNQTGRVWIEVEGESLRLDQFLAELQQRPPPLARIEQLSWQAKNPVGDLPFRIEVSAPDQTYAIFISPDVATCDECLAEMFDPTNRRYGYPFLNCTNCGPRLTIVTGAPYDRERTTMLSFPMCAPCRAEYENPMDRRFHAQPTACAVCGPALKLLDVRKNPIETINPITTFAAAIGAGKIGALKGLGGYHLVCEATNVQAVDELRRRKHRDEKPFALMVRDGDAVAQLAEVSAAETKLLQSTSRPIVLLRKRQGAKLADAIGPGNPFIGIMLPYTPLHHLLMSEVDGIPLVVTSGNRSDEPIAYEDVDALERLAGIADIFLTHNRPIHLRCDDTVTRIVAEAELPIRRSRGYAPRPITLPLECPRPTLAVGGQFKGTFALSRQRHAFLSHHLGDLDHLDAFRAFQRDIDLYEQLFAIQPARIVRDLHPDYASTRYAIQRAASERIPLLEVQHHHAHMASCMAENGLNEPVIGVTFDGTGFGSDGAIWGGEFLVGDLRSFRRAAHLRYVGLPGGDRAVREPWRTGLAHLVDANQSDSLLQNRVKPAELRTVHQMLERRFNTPMTSSAGRLFDAIASIAGVRDRVSFEGQAAMELEWLATTTIPGEVYPFTLTESLPGNSGEKTVQIDTRPLVVAAACDARAGIAANVIARRFHSTFVEMIASVCQSLRAALGLNKVALSGGVFMNALLTSETLQRLRKESFEVYRHRLVPPNDGGLSLGQLAIAAAQI